MVDEFERLVQVYGLDKAIRLFEEMRGEDYYD